MFLTRPCGCQLIDDRLSIEYRSQNGHRNMWGHNNVIKWKHFRVTGHLCREFTGQRWIPHTKVIDVELWFFFICVWINDWVNNREAGDVRRYRAHYDVIVIWAMFTPEELWFGPITNTNCAVIYIYIWYIFRCLTDRVSARVLQA